MADPAPPSDVETSTVELWVPVDPEVRVPFSVCHVKRPEDMDLDKGASSDSATTGVGAAAGASSGPARAATTDKDGSTGMEGAGKAPTGASSEAPLSTVESTGEAAAGAGGGAGGAGAGAGPGMVAVDYTSEKKAVSLSSEGKIAELVAEEAAAYLAKKRSIYGTRIMPRPDADDDSSDDSSDEEAVELLSGDEGEGVWEVEMALWAHVWITNVIMCEVLVRAESLLAGRSVFELGAGCAMSAVAAMLGGASRVVASDLYAEGLAVGALTAEANGADKSQLELRPLDWNEPVPSDLAGAFDLVIGSDVLYVPGAGPAIAQHVLSLLAPGGAAIITDPGRAAVEDFVEVCPSLGLHVVRHEAQFVTTSVSTIPKLLILVLTRVADADGAGAASAAAAAAAHVEAAMCHYRTQRAALEDESHASAIKTCLFE